MSPVFQYKAKNDRREDVAGSVEAVSEDEAVEKVLGQGLFLLDLKEVRADAAGLSIPGGAGCLFRGLRADILRWCEGRNGFVRLPLLAWFAYFFFRSLGDPHYQGFFGGINLGIHELGHIVFSFDGMFLSIAGGTILQLLAPLFGVYNFLRQKDYFAIALCFGWLSSNFFNVATYAGDARAMALPLVTPFGAGSSVQHDWNYLLSQMGMLSVDNLVALFFRACAVGSMAICLLMGGWITGVMIKGQLETKKTEV